MQTVQKSRRIPKMIAAQRASGDYVTRNDVLFVQREIKNTVQHQMNAKYSEKMSSNPEILGKAIATWWFKRNNELNLSCHDEAESIGPAGEAIMNETVEPMGLRASRALSEVPAIQLH